MQFPVSVPDDGFIDIVIQQRVRSAATLPVARKLTAKQRNRLEMITHIDDGPKGTMFWLESVRPFPCTDTRA